MNGEVCCILGVCCPADSQERLKAMTKTIVTDTGVSEEHAAPFAEWLIEHFDLAPKGSLQGFKDAIVKMVRHHETT